MVKKIKAKTHCPQCGTQVIKPEERLLLAIFDSKYHCDNCQGGSGDE